MTVKVAISAKNLEKETNYIKPYQVISGNIEEDKTVFTIVKLEEEVKNLDKKQRRNYKKVCSQMLTTATTFFTLISPVLASTGGAPMLTPDDIMKAGMWIIGIMAVASFVLTIILLQVAGGYKMIFRKKKTEANSWTIEILKGFTQIMIAPALVITIAMVMYLLFGGLDFFVSPF